MHASASQAAASQAVATLAAATLAAAEPAAGAALPQIAPRAPAFLRMFVHAHPVGATVLRRLTPADARPLRAAHRALAAAVTAASWRWSDADDAHVRIHGSGGAARGAARFAAAMPHACCGVTLVRGPKDERAAVAAALAALPRRLTALAYVDAGHDWERTLRYHLVGASFARFTALRSLSAHHTGVDDALVASLPRAVRRLNLAVTPLTPSVSFGHLPALRALDISSTTVGDGVVAALPPCLRVLAVAGTWVSAAVRFGHLPALAELDVAWTRVGDDALASLPPSVRALRLYSTALTPAARFDHLPLLAALNVSWTRISNASLATLPPSLREVALGSTALTPAASFDHLPALRLLHISVADAAVICGRKLHSRVQLALTW